MFDWFGLLIFLVAIYTVVIFSKFAMRYKEYFPLGIAITCLTVALAAMSSNFDLLFSKLNLTIYPEKFFEWNRVVAITALFCSLSVLIRDSKPDFARFPLSFSLFPLLIIITFPFVQNTLVIKEWVMGIYEGGAVIVGLIMYGTLTYFNRSYLRVLSSVGILSVSFIMYWFIPGMQNTSSSWLWKMVFIIGIFAFTDSYNKLYSERESPEENDGQIEYANSQMF